MKRSSQRLGSDPVQPSASGASSGFVSTTPVPSNIQEVPAEPPALIDRVRPKTPKSVATSFNSPSNMATVQTAQDLYVAKRLVHHEDDEEDEEEYESGSYISGTESEEEEDETDGVSIYSDHHMPPQPHSVAIDPFARPLSMDELRQMPAATAAEAMANMEAASKNVDVEQHHHHQHHQHSKSSSTLSKSSIRQSIDGEARASTRATTVASIQETLDKRTSLSLAQESILMDSVDLNANEMTEEELEEDGLGPLIGSPPPSTQGSPYPGLGSLNGIPGPLPHAPVPFQHGRFEHLAHSLNRTSHSPRPTPSPNRRRQRAASTSTTASTRTRHHAHFPTDTLPTLPPNMIPPAIVPVTPPSFSANSSEDVHEWLFDYTLAARNNNWPPATMLACVGVYLIGTAQQWYRYAGHRHAMWEEFAAALLDAFTSPTRAQQYFVRLQARKQRPDEAVRSYAHDVLLLCYLWNPEMDEKERVRWVREGLRREFWEDVILRQGKGSGFETVKELLECVETTEDLQGLTRVYEGLGRLAQRDRVMADAIRELSTSSMITQETVMDGAVSPSTEDLPRPIAATGSASSSGGGGVTGRFARWRSAVSSATGGSGSGLADLIRQ